MEHLTYFVPPEFFREEEFVDPDTFNYFKSNGWKVWSLFSPGLLWSIYNLRIKTGKRITINNWHTREESEYDKPGVFKWRGFRTPNCLDYSVYSQHSGGKALDFDVEDFTAEEVREFILKDQWDDCCKYITAIEMTKNSKSISWVHIDCRNHDKEIYGIKKINA